MCIDWESKGTVPFKEVLKGRRWWKHAEWTGLSWEVSETNSNNSVSVGLSGKVISFKGHLKTRIVTFSWELHFYFGWLAKSEMCTYIQSCITQLFSNIIKKSHWLDPGLFGSEWSLAAFRQYAIFSSSCVHDEYLKILHKSFIH